MGWVRETKTDTKDVRKYERESEKEEILFFNLNKSVLNATIRLIEWLMKCFTSASACHAPPSQLLSTFFHF